MPKELGERQTDFKENWIFIRLLHCSDIIKFLNNSSLFIFKIKIQIQFNWKYNNRQKMYYLHDTMSHDKNTIPVDLIFYHAVSDFHHCQKHKYAIIKVPCNLIRNEYALSKKLSLPISKKGNS